MQNKKFLVVLMGLILVFVVAMLPYTSACTTEDDGDGGNGEAPTSIRMGLTTPLSGDAAAWGIAQLRAVELLADEFGH